MVPNVENERLTVEKILYMVRRRFNFGRWATNGVRRSQITSLYKTVRRRELTAFDTSDDDDNGAETKLYPTPAER